MQNKPTILRQLRQPIPARPLTLNDAYRLAEQQAARTLELLGVTELPVDVARIADLPKIEVQVQPRHRMKHLAGFSQWVNGRWLIVVNKNSVEGRRRFTLAHEFKHVLDSPIAKTAYAQLGHGDTDKRYRQVESICDYFAACLLMPAPAVKRLWYSGFQDIDALALHFRVSRAAMRIRLEYFGFIGENLPVHQYFRSERPLLAHASGCLA